MNITTTARHTDLANLTDILRAQQDAKYDVVITGDRFAYEDGLVAVAGGAIRWTDDGADEVAAMLAPTDAFEGQLAERLGIPHPYLRKVRDAGALGLLDANVNQWVEPGGTYLIRGFRTDDPDQVGIARACLSDRYAPIDHMDVMFAALAGIAGSGVEGVEVTGADLTEKSMRLIVEAPAVTAMAQEFLAHYRSPFGGGTSPLISAGLEVKNSETGQGAFQIAPRIVVLACRNGMTRTVDAVRRVHLGERLAPGAVTWSQDTLRKNVDLIAAQAKDAVTTFLSQDYLAGVAAELDAAAGRQVDDPANVFVRVGQRLRYTQDEQQAMLALFIQSGDPHASGVAQAVTAYAQTVDDADRASELEASAFDALAVA
jgi:hypothetical protein